MAIIAVMIDAAVTKTLSSPKVLSPLPPWTTPYDRSLDYRTLWHPVVGIVGLYLHLRRSRGFGRLGAVGFYVCLLVFALVAILDIGIIVNEGVEQTYMALGPVRGPGLMVGLVLFRVTTLRQGSLPRGGAWFLIAAALTNALAVLAMIISGGTLGGSSSCPQCCSGSDGHG